MCPRLHSFYQPNKVKSRCVTSFNFDLFIRFFEQSSSSLCWCVTGDNLSASSFAPELTLIKHSSGVFTGIAGKWAVVHRGGWEIAQAKRICCRCRNVAFTRNCSVHSCNGQRFKRLSLSLTLLQCTGKPAASVAVHVICSLQNVFYWLFLKQQASIYCASMGFFPLSLPFLGLLVFHPHSAHFSWCACAAAWRWWCDACE